MEYTKICSYWTINYEFNYFIRLNKAVFVLGEFGNAYHIKKDYAKLAGYIDIISDDNLAKEFIGKNNYLII